MACVVTRNESTLGNQRQEKMIRQGRQRLILFIDCRGHWVDAGILGGIIFARYKGNGNRASRIGTGIAVCAICRNQFTVPIVELDGDTLLLRQRLKSES